MESTSRGSGRSTTSPEKIERGKWERNPSYVRSTKCFRRTTGTVLTTGPYSCPTYLDDKKFPGWVIFQNVQDNRALSFSYDGDANQFTCVLLVITLCVRTKPVPFIVAGWKAGNSIRQRLVLLGVAFYTYGLSSEESQARV